jgi:hypothetical protein
MELAAKKRAGRAIGRRRGKIALVSNSEREVD